MNLACKHCSQAFEITQSDLEFYEKVSPVFNGKKELIPPPDYCPDCRLLIRMSHRNERNLYHRKCDFTGKQIISIYSPAAPYAVYAKDVWWSDQYSPLEYGREYDFTRSFFEQFHDLEIKVPKVAIFNANSQNSDYTNYSAENQNCYMVVGGLGCERCYYSYRTFYSQDCCDCFDLYRSERCYECSESSQLYECKECRNCHNSSDCILCQDCNGCRNCFACVNLRNKQFCIYNQQCTKEEYEIKVTQLLSTLKNIRPDVEALSLQEPHLYAHILQSEQCLGDQILSSKNCHHCYTVKNSQDCKYVQISENNKDSQDCNFTDNCELMYNTANNEKNYGVLFSSLNWYSSSLQYCMNCFHSKNLFGCTGMKKNAYCILNKQYSENEYFSLAPKIIDHMRSTDEWGKFFPPHISAFGYNESVAKEYSPMTRDDVLARGWMWYEEEKPKNQYLGPPTDIPDTINNVSDDITTKILTCSVTGKPYKIIPQELTFYREMNIPIPRKCPDQRHKERMALRNPRKLWKRECAKCSKQIQTTYAPDRPEIVYCQDCYLQTVY